jgi:hypothetical protein
LPIGIMDRRVKLGDESGGEAKPNVSPATSVTANRDSPSSFR